MSKIVDRFKQLSRGTAPSLGFRAASDSSQNVRMLLIAGLTKTSAEAAKVLVGSGVDAVLLRSDEFEMKSLKKTVTTLGDIPFGVSLGERSSEAVGKIVDSGCDFMVISQKAPAGILVAEGLGKVLEVKPNLDAGFIRAINDLMPPVDGVLIAQEEEKPYLMVEQLLVCQRFVEILDKPLLITIPSSVTADQLNSLWQVGIDGVVIFEERLDLFSELRKLIDSLSRKARRRPTKTVPLLPKITGEIGAEVEEEEEE